MNTRLLPNTLKVIALVLTSTLWACGQQGANPAVVNNGLNNGLYPGVGVGGCASIGMPISFNATGASINQYEIYAGNLSQIQSYPTGGVTIQPGNYGQVQVGLGATTMGMPNAMVKQGQNGMIQMVVNNQSQITGSLQLNQSAFGGWMPTGNMNQYGMTCITGLGIHAVWMPIQQYQNIGNFGVPGQLYGVLLSVQINGGQAVTIQL